MPERNGEGMNKTETRLLKITAILMILGAIVWFILALKELI